MIPSSRWIRQLRQDHLTGDFIAKNKRVAQERMEFEQFYKEGRLNKTELNRMLYENSVERGMLRRMKKFLESL
jgi:hypothetical protein